VAQMVIKDGAVWRIGRVRQFGIERLVPVVADARANGVSGFEEINGGCGDGLRFDGNFAERSHVIENIETPTVGSDHQIVHVIVSVEDHVANGSAGQILAQRLPVVAVIE